MLSTSSYGRTKTFDFFHWLSKTECVAPRISFYFRPEWRQFYWRALRKKAQQMRPFPIDPKESFKFPRYQSSTSPATVSFSIVIVVFCCSCREGEKKRLKTPRIQSADITITLLLTTSWEIIKLSSNRQRVWRNVCLNSRKGQEETLSQVKRRRNTTLAKQTWNWKSEGDCGFSLKDLADSSSLKCIDVEFPKWVKGPCCDIALWCLEDEANGMNISTWNLVCFFYRYYPLIEASPATATNETLCHFYNSKN